MNFCTDQKITRLQTVAFHAKIVDYLQIKYTGSPQLKCTFANCLQQKWKKNPEYREKKQKLQNDMMGILSSAKKFCSKNIL